MATELHIFYADDDPDDLNFFRDVTDAINKPIQLHTHDRGDKLLQALHKFPFSSEIIFLDLNMPGKDGFDVLQEIRSSEDLKDIPVIIFSTASDVQNISKSMKLGANYFVQKSNSFEALKRSIEDTIAINWSTFRPSRKNFMYQNPLSTRRVY